jgi:hypothetical protein
MAAGGHFHFDNDHNVSRIKGNSTSNKMTPVWCRSVKRFESYRTFYVLASYHFYGWENEVWQDSHAIRILDNSVLSKMTPVWSRYLKRFKSCSILKCWSSKIQDCRRRPKWRNFSVSLGRSLSIVKRYICAKGDVCSICSFVTVHFVTYIQTYIHTDRHLSIA